MKRLFAMIILLALLCIACGGQTKSDSAASVVTNPTSSGTAVTQQATETAAVLPTAAAASAEALDDPTDTTKVIDEKIQAQADRTDFLEDCLAEMAGLVYG